MSNTDWTYKSAYNDERSSPDQRAKLALINVRSLRNKTLFVRSYVDERSVVVTITEIWLAAHEIIVAELCGENFTFVHKPRGASAVSRA